MAVKIKICGLTRAEDVKAINEIGADYIGFVFAKSKRRINMGVAKQLKEQLSPRIQAVGVFVNENISYIEGLCKNKIIDVIQLHGDETVDYALELKKRVNNPIIKAIRVKNTEQILAVQAFPCDYFLLDTFLKDQYGGGGKVFDWSIIPKLQKPFFLAGGLNFENVEEAILQAHPYCVDLSSGAETDGLKDAEKIKRIAEKVRSVK